MNIAFFGDIHGQVYHLLAAIIAWQKRTGTALDMVIQVGDFGVERLEKMIQNTSVFLRYPANNPAQFDFLRVMHAQNQLATHLKAISQQLPMPIHFLRGNHDDAEWLRQLSSHDVWNQTATIDPFDLFQYVHDGTTIIYGGMKMAFFGGVEHPERGEEGTGHDSAAFRTLLTIRPGDVDVLVTHEPPYGCSTGFRGQVQGSSQVSKLIETIQPRYHIAGHLHTMIGPRQYGPTTYFGLNQFGGLTKQKPRQRDPSQTLQQGTMALLNTDTGILEFVTGDWLAEFSRECEELVDACRLFVLGIAAATGDPQGSPLPYSRYPPVVDVGGDQASFLHLSLPMLACFGYGRGDPCGSPVAVVPPSFPFISHVPVFRLCWNDPSWPPVVRSHPRPHIW